MLCACWEGSLPASCARCRYVQYREDNLLGSEMWAECVFTKEVVDKDQIAYHTRRSPNCPLAEQKK